MTRALTETDIMRLIKRRAKAIAAAKQKPRQPETDGANDQRDAGLTS